ncbi:hypothetical protein [Truepera radiovictrix]|uniref:Sensory transduction histidine kinase n=1 Tax=Truepera radiovictrix (strain DSM 17093 / CIP 108686 / LMG 22925 / RQ-24) TaxID=649638 RepID=D7CQV1_TRURR|nr:hypothetical protein [Truepera radiovictrix]ADI15085.1 sensory transduction histidine kinase [Truepera radiovictrix DSM 17093]WMT56362.1 hypothetical protein RCV51_10135 [Truepera radiovictrix]
MSDQQDDQADSQARNPDRAQPELTELNLLIQELENETDPERKAALRRQLEQMEREVGEANSR